MRDGVVFAAISAQSSTNRLGSAENPAVTLRDPPSLGREGALRKRNLICGSIELQPRPIDTALTRRGSEAGIASYSTART